MAWVNQVLHCETLGPGVGRTAGGQGFFEFATLGLRVHGHGDMHPRRRSGWWQPVRPRSRS